METTNLDAFKSNKIRPTMAGLSDSKYTAKDCNIMLGITNPFSYEITEYLGYDITKLRGNVRFLEVVLNRDGESNDMVPLFFDGATNYFSELPPLKDSNAMNKIITHINNLKSQTAKSFFMYTINKIRSIYNSVKNV